MAFSAASWGGLTGACWETTPDGRPGWLHNFLSAGFAVYVLDNVERGRSGFVQLKMFGTANLSNER